MDRSNESPEAVGAGGAAADDDNTLVLFGLLCAQVEAALPVFQMALGLLSPDDPVYRRILLQYENYHRLYASRVRNVGAGRGCGRRLVIPRRLSRYGIYEALCMRSDAHSDRILSATGFPRGLFLQFCDFVKPALAALPRRVGLSMTDRLVYFFLRCRRGQSFSTMEGSYGVSRAALCSDFGLIMDALYSFLVENSDTKLINRVPYDVDELTGSGGQSLIPVPSTQLHPLDPSTNAQRYRNLKPVAIIGLVDGKMVQVERPRTPDGERQQGLDRARSRYSSYKKKTALNYVVVSDVRGRVLLVLGGYGGRANDRSLFNQSALGTDYGSLFSSTRHVLLGDGGFAGQGSLITNFSKRQLSAASLLRGSRDPEEVAQILAGRFALNAAVKQFRSSIEHVFGCCVKKWVVFRDATGMFSANVGGERTSRLIKLLLACIRFQQDRGHALARGNAWYFEEQARLWLEDLPDNYIVTARERVRRAMT